MFIKDHKMHITILRIKRSEIRALGVGCGPDPIDILLHIGQRKSTSLAHAPFYIGEFFDRSSANFGHWLLLLGFDVCLGTDLDELQGFNFMSQLMGMGRRKSI
jgi:hypothetical protein